MKRVAVTGIGVVCPLGNDPASLFAALCQGRSAIGRLAGRAHERLSAKLGAAVAFDAARHFAGAKLRSLDRVSQFALFAAAQAVADAHGVFEGLDRERAGVAVGTGMGGAETTDEGFFTLYAEQSNRLKPLSVLLAMNNAPAAWIGLEYRLNGPNLTYSTACSSSAVAIGEAARRIACGDAQIMIAGGSEAPLTFGTLSAWEALRTLATEDESEPWASCKPFAKNRTGLVLGEGAAMLVLEEWSRALGRGARIRAEISGYGLTTDTAHITRPSVEGQASAMRSALKSAALAPEEVDYINAHGTGTNANDLVETAAIKEVFGERAYRIPVSSTKSMHGHLLGAAGALEFSIALLALEHGTVPPTAHLKVPDPDCDLDYVSQGARRYPDLALLSCGPSPSGVDLVS